MKQIESRDIRTNDFVGDLVEIHYNQRKNQKTFEKRSKNEKKL